MARRQRLWWVTAGAHLPPMAQARLHRLQLLGVLQMVSTGAFPFVRLVYQQTVIAGVLVVLMMVFSVLVVFQA